MSEPYRRSDEKAFLGIKANGPVFIASLLVILVVVTVTLIVGNPMEQWFAKMQRVVSSNVGWCYILLVNLLLFFTIYLSLSKYGNIRLGGKNAKPRFSLTAWFAMLFSAGMGIGLLFWSVAEPKHTDAVTSGNITFDATLDTGHYFAALFIRDSNIRISKKAAFTIESGTSFSEKGAGAPDLDLYPVPTTGMLHLHLSRIPDAGITLRIVSPAGQTIYENSSPSADSVRVLNIDLSGHPRGIYLLSVVTGDHVLVKKLILI